MAGELFSNRDTLTQMSGNSVVISPDVSDAQYACPQRINQIAGSQASGFLLCGLPKRHSVCAVVELRETIRLS